MIFRVFHGGSSRSLILENRDIRVVLATDLGKRLSRALDGMDGTKGHEIAGLLSRKTSGLSSHSATTIVPSTSAIPSIER